MKKISESKGESGVLRFSNLPANYRDLLESLKNQIRLARHKAGLAVNRELICLYWQIGRAILSRQNNEGWGAKVIDRLSLDLRQTFPEMKGLSGRNLKYMRAFAEIYPDEEFVQQVAAQIPWFHHCVLLDKVKDSVARDWYISKVIENGWSRNVLVVQIESALFERQGKAITNFEHTLPPTQSDLAQQIFKDPYCFDFLSIGEKIHERELEKSLLNHFKDFLIELGKGFAFVGSQYRLEVSGEDYFIDLLFYHLRLHCYVIIDLKMGKFIPEYAGKMNFYLSAADDLLRHPIDRPSIGLILCKSRDRIVAEYTLRDLSKPMGIASFRATSAMPEEMQESLPTIEQLEEELSGLKDDV